MTCKHFTLLALLLPALFLAFGCRAALRPIPNEGEVILTYETELDYNDELLGKSRVSIADAARLILQLDGGDPLNKNLDVLYKELLDRELIKADWDVSESAPLTAGKLAFMICQAAEIKTSLIMRFTPPSEHYAFREAMHHKLMPASGIDRYVSGQELFDALSMTKSWMLRRDENG